MHKLLILAAKTQTQVTTSPEFKAGQAIGTAGVPCVVLLVSIFAVVEAARKGYANPLYLGLALFGSVLLPTIVRFTDAPPAVVIATSLIGAVAWLSTLIWYAVVSRKARNSQKKARQQHQGNPYGQQQQHHRMASPPNQRHPQGAPHPHHQQTQSAPEVEELDDFEEVVAGDDLLHAEVPEASHHAAEPVATGPVKVRCKSCYRRMVLDSAQLAGLTACPSCHASPFQYRTDA